MAKYTREKIIDAFFALASENPEKSNFTISEIASKAGISRQAIYQKHFKNFNEIILYVHNLIDKEICQVFNNYNPSSNINPLDYIGENVLPAIWKERQWIRCLYTTNIDPNFEGFIVSTYTKWGASNIVPKEGQFNLSNEEVVQLVTSLTVVVIKNWITQDNPSPPKQFKGEFLRLIRTPIYEYINHTAVTVSD
ncbi:TetR/AcrR family transcriptional regulator [Streptococcus gallolyticus]|uniref:TetR/AcrR family transcriptional regulator n=1 Tax=Streptococcus gallolyticus TaxID=315405 RepID=UPI002283A681|nr:TetR/AcrR family transcriptional regulator [Streptococcus gallolyticus]MCY7184323.1 TetR/AcrR family transcriptional regulator [Streptococcus gallolyticus subsp. gallolyticus]MCY7190540.1 TetR/AcrR family transcriptional regulator [Streptococcus gallolyticus subsp. gallolyticus]